MSGDGHDRLSDGSVKCDISEASRNPSKQCASTAVVRKTRVLLLWKTVHVYRSDMNRLPWTLKYKRCSSGWNERESVYYIA